MYGRPGCGCVVRKGRGFLAQMRGVRAQACLEAALALALAHAHPFLFSRLALALRTLAKAKAYLKSSHGGHRVASIIITSFCSLEVTLIYGVLLYEKLREREHHPCV